jgi:hypothetical protein
MFPADYYEGEDRSVASQPLVTVSVAQMGNGQGYWCLCTSRLCGACAGLLCVTTHARPMRVVYPQVPRTCILQMLRVAAVL